MNYGYMLKKLREIEEKLEPGEHRIALNQAIGELIRWAGYDPQEERDT